MRISGKERSRLRRFERSGVPVEWRALDRRFNFAVSPITTNTIDVSVLVRLAAEVALRVQRKKIDWGLNSVVLFPIVANADVYVRENFITHKRVDKSYFVGRNIDFGSWLRARVPGRLSLAVKNFEDSVVAIPEKHFSAEAKSHDFRLLERRFLGN